MTADFLGLKMLKCLPWIWFLWPADAYLIYIKNSISFLFIFFENAVVFNLCFKQASILSQTKFKSPHKNQSCPGWSGYNGICPALVYIFLAQKHLHLHLLQPWPTWFTCGDLDYYLGQCDFVSLSQGREPETVAAMKWISRYSKISNTVLLRQMMW